eukprot:COSAG03_NODE_76_length_14245_cov_10.406122_2_plen_353_part_00
MQLPDGLQSHFETFGYLHLRNCFSPDEMAAATARAEALWAANGAGQNRRPGGQGLRAAGLLELDTQLIELAADDRIWGVARQLLGDDFVYVGSEGNVSDLETFSWHSDRKYYGHPTFAAAGDVSLLPPAFTQLKMMLYLEPLDDASGCLSVVPGSHRSPIHEAMGPQEYNRSAEPQPFGVKQPDLPRVALASNPGDVIVFCHTLFHAVFNARGGHPPRRYLALKFSERPKTPEQLFTLVRYTPQILTPAPTMTGDSGGSAVSEQAQGSPSDRLRAMVAPWVALSEALGEATVSEIASTTQANWSKPAAAGESTTAAALAKGWRGSVGPLQSAARTTLGSDCLYRRIAWHQRL